MATSTNGATGAQRWKEMSKPEVGDWRVKGGLAQMLKGGVIMDVVNDFYRRWRIARVIAHTKDMSERSSVDCVRSPAGADTLLLGPSGGSLLGWF